MPFDLVSRCALCGHDPFVIIWVDEGRTPICQDEAACQARIDVELWTAGLMR